MRHHGEGDTPHSAADVLNLSAPDLRSERMLAGILIIATAGFCAFLASRFMWWATKRSAVWAMFAGALLVIAVFLGAIVIAWVYTVAEYGW